jgi:heat shock protein HtpX
MIEEEIRANRRKILAGRMVFLLYVTVYTCAIFLPPGFVFVRAAGAAGLAVILVSLTMWLVITGLALYHNVDIVRRVAGAQPLVEGRYPRLASAAEDIAIASGQEVPHLMLIEDDAINAFSMISIRARHSVVFCTEGMARDLHLDEMRAIMAHELAHLKNGDAELGSLVLPFSYIPSYLIKKTSWIIRSLVDLSKLIAIVVVATLLIFLLTPLAIYMNDHSSSFLAYYDVFAIILIGLLLPFISLYLLGALISFFRYFSLRNREYLADETALEWTNFPEGLIDALLKAGERNTGSDRAFLDDACFAPPSGVRGFLDYQPSLIARIDNIRKETYLPPEEGQSK